MSKKLIPLNEFNSKRHVELTYPKFNGIECPKCGSEMMDIDNMVLTSFPPKKNIKCSNGMCNHNDYRYC